MSKYLGKVSDKRNRTAYLTDNSFPNIEEVEHSEVNNKKFKLYWLATYTENSHLYEVFFEETDKEVAQGLEKLQQEVI